jgi:hypothetical protein
VARGFSPLDEELALLPGPLTPRLQETLVRLGTVLPFGRAARLFTHCTHTTVSESTARRLTERAGATYAAVQEAEASALARTLPACADAPRCQLLSADGAMVPLRGGVWGEVKLLAIGEVGEGTWERDEWVVHTRALSYFSRMTDAQTFGELARVETHRRGTERAEVVCAVTDGAEWLQGLIDLHRPDAVRILDFAHAAGYVTRAAQAVFGAQSTVGAAWITAQLHELKWGEAARVVAAVQALPSARCPAEARAVVVESVGYLTKRLPQMQYATFRALGYPIGSGSVESGHKVVTQARLAGAGMHWARGQVNALCALCAVESNARWDEAWPQVVWRRRVEQRCRVNHRRTVRRAARAQPTITPDTTVRVSHPTPNAPLPPATHRTPWRPAANHPWRRTFRPSPVSLHRAEC